MATTTPETDRLIDAIAEFMRRVDVEEAILFGSRARAEELKSSDVDLIVISPRFEGTRFTDRIGPLLAEWPRGLPTLEVLAYTPEEFERARHGTRIERKADEEGVRLRLRDDEDGVSVISPPGAQTGGTGMIDEARRWLVEADVEERTARIVAEAGIPSRAVSHARQAVEHALKAAVIELQREEAPKIHSLFRLAEQVCEELPDEIRDAVKDLDPHYLTSRYPSDLVPQPSEYFDESDAERALGKMALVFDWVREQLPEEEEADDEDGDAADESREAT
jgi:hypothetical protein